MADVREKGPSIKRTAGEAIGLLLPVALVGAEAFVADNTNSAHRGKVSGISVDVATILGEEQRIQVYGPLSDPSWTWTPGLPIYVGDGVLTQSKPETGWVQVVAKARTATEVWVQVTDQDDADKTYRHSQAVPAATWVVAHGLNKHPSVTVVDSSGKEVYGEVTHDSSDQATIRFTAGFAGTAYCN